MLTAWIKNIIFIVLFASFLELLLPNSSMQRFVRVIMGLFIMLAILGPVIDVVQHSLTPIQVPTLSGSGGNPTAILHDAQNFAQQRETIAATQYKKELAQQMQVMITALEGVADAKVVIETNDNDGGQKGTVKSVMVYLTPGMASKTLPVKKVMIGEEGKTISDVNSQLAAKVKRLLTELYQLPKEIITVQGVRL